MICKELLSNFLELYFSSHFIAFLILPNLPDLFFIIANSSLCLINFFGLTCLYTTFNPSVGNALSKGVVSHFFLFFENSLIGNSFLGKDKIYTKLPLNIVPCGILWGLLYSVCKVHEILCILHNQVNSSKSVLE